MPDGMSTSDSTSNDSKEYHPPEPNDDALHDHVTIHPNAWSRYRLVLRAYVAEFVGVCILIIFGTGVDCRVVLSSVTGVASSQKGVFKSYLSISFGWAIGISTAMGVRESGGISGGHINPTVIIALAMYRGFPWRKVPIFVLTMNIFEGDSHIRTLSTASVFSTYALDYMASVSCFFSELLVTAVLLVVVLAINDKKNMPLPAGLVPLVLFILVLGIGACLGMETTYEINPTLDLGLRLLTSMVGY
ncbi:aquaporin-like protein [Mycena sp. CBHHK59/15]|nr:aquaporin-like protein [Mycena sp. CBHHK59/15]